MKKKPTTNTEKKSALIERVIAVKKRLPNSGVTSLFVQMFPTYKPTAKRNKISAVLQFRSTDADVIDRLEKIADAINI
jgi:hypothetical protein